MGEGKKSQWHPAFYGALRLELVKNKQDLEFTEEFILNTLPLRVDTLIIKKKSCGEIYNEIGKIFKRYNLVEYKSPKDTLNENTFLKGVAYAILYKVKEVHVGDICMEDITLTFIRERKPIKLFKILKERKFVVEEYRPGIYYITKENYLMVQIIVSGELDKKNHVWLNSLTNRLSEERAKELVYITGGLKDLDDKYYADSVWEIVTTQNIELIKKMREDKEMCKAMAEIFKPEIDAAFNSGFDSANS